MMGRALLVLLAMPALLAAQFGEFHWGAAGPNGLPSRLSAIAIPSQSSTTIFAGSPGGGLWRTVDGGNAWYPLTDSAPSSQVCAVALDPSDSNRIYVGTSVTAPATLITVPIRPPPRWPACKRSARAESAQPRGRPARSSTAARRSARVEESGRCRSAATRCWRRRSRSRCCCSVAADPHRGRPTTPG